MHKPFHNLYLFIENKKPAALACLILLFAVLLFVGSKVEFNEDINKFIPKNSKNEALQKVLASTKFNDNIIVHFIKEDSIDIDVLTDLASSFIDSLELNEKARIESIQGYVEDENIFEILDFAYHNTAIYLKDQDYKDIDNKLDKDSIANIIEKNYRSLISTAGIASKDLILKDPLGISLMALKNLNPLGSNEDFVLKNGFLVTHDENHLLLFISPKSKRNGTKSDQELIGYLNKIRPLLIADNHYLDIEYYGGAFIANANSQQIKYDIKLTVGVALIALILLFVFFYKKAIIPLILVVPTLFGALLGICVLYFLRAQVSAISLGIGALLLGITLDYALHILTHIRSGLSIEQIYRGTTKPIIMSSLTTALAFLCLLFIDSQALQDLGIFASVSVLGASIFALLFIPQMYRPKKLIIEKLHAPNILERVATYEFHKNKILVIILLLLAVVCGFTYNKVEFNKDLSNLNYISPELLKAEKNLDSITNETSKTLYIAAYGDNFEDVLNTNDSIATVLEDLQKNNIIKFYNTLSSLYKSAKNQNKNIEKWNLFWTISKKDTLSENLVSEGQKFGFKENAFQAFYDQLNKGFTPISLNELNIFGEKKLENFYSKSTDFSTITSIIKVENSKIYNVTSAFPNTDSYILIDRQAINESLLGNLKNDFNSLILYCAIAVIGIIFLFYRNIRLTIVTIVPILITWVITIGIMGIMGLDFNIFNIIISSFIFGLGVDYSIFITNGLQSKLQGLNMNLATNKTSILLSVITTLLGVGVMIFAKHPALNSIALISIIGIITSMLIAFTIQPLLFNYLIKNSYEQD